MDNWLFPLAKNLLTGKPKQKISSEDDPISHSIFLISSTPVALPVDWKIVAELKLKLRNNHKKTRLERPVVFQLSQSQEQLSGWRKYGEIFEQSHVNWPSIRVPAPAMLTLHVRVALKDHKCLFLIIVFGSNKKLYWRENFKKLNCNYLNFSWRIHATSKSLRFRAPKRFKLYFSKRYYLR